PERIRAGFTGRAPLRPDVALQSGPAPDPARLAACREIKHLTLIRTRCGRFFRTIYAPHDENSFPLPRPMGLCQPEPLSSVAQSALSARASGLRPEGAADGAR